ncbi:MAG: beta-ketoacyl-[acyl-carrier-protein] synthase family protein [Planctomycetota bacterium]
MPSLPVDSDSARRVVITGLGAITPFGCTVESLNDALQAGESAIRPMTQVPLDVLASNYGCEAVEFTGNIENYGPLEKKLQRTIRKGSKVMAREIEMGVAAAQRALLDTGFDPAVFDSERTGVVYGSDYIMSLPEEYAEGIKATMVDGRFEFTRWGELGLPKVNPLWLLKYLPNMPASHIAIYNDLRGPNNSITLREASAYAAMAEAYSTLRRGHADALVVGSTGSRIHPLRSLHATMQETLAKTAETPEKLSRPFDASRQGSVLGEGAAAMMLETLEHAEQRGATILGELVGYGSSAVGSAPGRDHLRQAIVNVLRRVIQGVPPSDIGHIHAHGLGTVESDRQEAAAIADVFGDAADQPPVTTAKGHFGNLGAGGGMVEAIASLNALGKPLFPIRNLETLDPSCPINAVTQDNPADAGESFVSLNVTPQGQASAIRINRFAA